LSWAGSPAQFGYAKLAGKFSLETAPGRFTEMEPGLAKLLGVLSLQSLPRRLSFNFDDIFGRGFAFDEIKADVTLADGSAKTDNFQISGPSARVQIRGTADINRETQDLHVRLFPSLSTATAIGIGIMTANPAIGAAALLGQKLARDPIERLLMQEFDVKGTWTKPETTPVKSGAGAAVGTTASDVAQ
ncbi:MAG TPA: AsmA-like C-terminal region-containing protein, partial [Casimicrobium sp.]|nr:AsmA-like C-terminal region-containing protein [Casimicrobium sp.]